MVTTDWQLTSKAGDRIQRWLVHIHQFVPVEWANRHRLDDVITSCSQDMNA